MMVSFWIFSIGSALVLTFFLVLPMKLGKRQEASRADFDIDVYKDQLAELDKECGRGAISEKDAQSVKGELKRRMLKALNQGRDTEPKSFSHGATWAALILTPITLPTAAMAAYFYLGAPGMPSFPLAERGNELERAAEQQQITGMVDKLAEKMQKNPDDPKGWAMLGRSYRVMGRYEDSVKAYEQAVQRSPGNPELALEYGETLIFSAEGYVSPRARKIVETVLKDDPQNLKGRFYLGLAMSETREELPQAIEVWQQLLADLPKDADWKPTLKDQIDRAKRALSAAEQG